MSKTPAATFVLVHGAWHGGWCWAPVAERLAAAGHAVHVPTLRGLAHRSASLTRATDADAHVRDIVDLVEALDLGGVVLALHSYAGLLGPALIAALRPRLASIVWIEAVVPRPGQRMLDLILPEAAERYARQVREQGEGWKMPAPDPAQFNLPDPALVESLRGRLTPHPWRSFTEPVTAPQDDPFAFPGRYLIASDRNPQPYAAFADQARAAGWPVTSAPGGHLLMLTNPAAVVQALIQDRSTS